MTPRDGLPPHPRFAEALAALDAGDLNNGTALHRAAWDGDLLMVQRLVARGADVADRNNPFTATALSWAQHNKQSGVFEWMRQHCAIDLHDAVSFDLKEHVQARLRDDPASVHKRLDHRDVPQGTALHWAAKLGREELARLLLDGGADPNILAGNGLTALDLAECGGRGGCGAAAGAARRKASGGPLDEQDRLLPSRRWFRPAKEGSCSGP